MSDLVCTACLRYEWEVERMKEVTDDGQWLCNVCDPEEEGEADDEQ